MGSEPKNLEHEVHYLTTALSVLSPNVSSPVPHRKRDTIANAYHDIATLLTTGAGDPGTGNRVVAVTGSPLTNRGLGLFVVASEIFNDHGAGSSASESDNNNGSNPTENIAITQNASKTKLETCTVMKVERSERTLQELAEPISLDQLPSLSVENHTAELLQVLFTVGRSPTPENLVSMDRFITNRCFLKIERRFNTNMKAFKAILPALKDWTPTSAELSNPVSFSVSKPVSRVLTLFRVPALGTPPQSHILDRESAPRWLAAFIHFLNMCGDCLSKYRMNVLDVHLLDGCNGAIDWLNNLMYSIKALEIIFSLPSLNTRLVALAMSGEAFGAPDSTPGEDDPDVAEQKPELGEAPGAVTLRGLRTIVAWHKATRSLTRSKLFRNPDIKADVHIITVPLALSLHLQPVFDPLMANLGGRLRARQHEEDDIVNVLREFSETLARIRQLRGTVHCEATLMCIAAGLAGSHPPSSVHEKLRTIFQDSNGIIGVCKKSCFTCFWLANNLQEKPFNVPGSHGTVYGWVPPTDPFRIPGSVLIKLINELMNKLVDTAEEHIVQADKRLASTQSSPSTSDEGRYTESLYDSEVINYSASLDGRLPWE